MSWLLAQGVVHIHLFIGLAFLRRFEQIYSAQNGLIRMDEVGANDCQLDFSRSLFALQRHIDQLTDQPLSFPPDIAKAVDFYHWLFLIIPARQQSRPIILDLTDCDTTFV